jgi:hypothetical protein
MTDNGETAAPPTGCLRISPARRALDIIVAAVLLVILTPFIAVIAVLILVMMGRPVSFTQVRVGERGRRFVLSKLRTMRVVASGPEVTGQGDVCAPEVVFHAAEAVLGFMRQESAAQTAGIAAEHLQWAAAWSGGSRD